MRQDPPFRTDTELQLNTLPLQAIIEAEAAQGHQGYSALQTFISYHCPDKLNAGMTKEQAAHFHAVLTAHENGKAEDILADARLVYLYLQAYPDHLPEADRTAKGSLGLLLDKVSMGYADKKTEPLKKQAACYADLLTLLAPGALAMPASGEDMAHIAASIERAAEADDDGARSRRLLRLAGHLHTLAAQQAEGERNPAQVEIIQTIAAAMGATLQKIRGLLGLR